MDRPSAPLCFSTSGPDLLEQEPRIASPRPSYSKAPVDRSTPSPYPRHHPTRLNGNPNGNRHLGRRDQMSKNRRRLPLYPVLVHINACRLVWPSMASYVDPILALRSPENGRLIHRQWMSSPSARHRMLHRCGVNGVFLGRRLARTLFAAPTAPKWQMR